MNRLVDHLIVESLTDRFHNIGRQGVLFPIEQTPPDYPLPTAEYTITDYETMYAFAFDAIARKLDYPAQSMEFSVKHHTDSSAGGERNQVDELMSQLPSSFVMYRDIGGFTAVNYGAGYELNNPEGWIPECADLKVKVAVSEDDFRRFVRDVCDYVEEPLPIGAVESDDDLTKIKEKI